MTRFSHLTHQSADRRPRRAGDCVRFAGELLFALRGWRSIFCAPPVAAEGAAILLRVAFSVVICYLFNLTTTKWRFISLPDALKIFPARGLGAGRRTGGAGLYLQGPLRRAGRRATCFFGRITIILYWFLEIFALSALRFGYRYFRYARVRRHARTDAASTTLLIGLERPTPEGAAARDRKRRRQAALAGRRACRRQPPTAASRSVTFRCSAGQMMSTTSFAISPGATR